MTTKTAQQKFDITTIYNRFSDLELLLYKDIPNKMCFMMPGSMKDENLPGFRVLNFSMGLSGELEKRGLKDAKEVTVETTTDNTKYRSYKQFIEHIIRRIHIEFKLPCPQNDFFFDLKNQIGKQVGQHKQTHSESIKLIAFFSVISKTDPSSSNGSSSIEHQLFRDIFKGFIEDQLKNLESVDVKSVIYAQLFLKLFDADLNKLIIERKKVRPNRRKKENPADYYARKAQEAKERFDFVDEPIQVSAMTLAAERAEFEMGGEAAYAEFLSTERKKADDRIARLNQPATTVRPVREPSQEEQDAMEEHRRQLIEKKQQKQQEQKDHKQRS